MTRLILAFGCVVAAALAASPSARAGAKAGKLHIEAYNELSQMQREALDEADKYFNQKNYKLAAPKYDIFEARFRDTAGEAVPYVIWMSGLCNEYMKKRDTARYKFELVMELYPASTYAVNSLYQRGLSYYRDGDDQLAFQDFKELYDNWDAVDDHGIRMDCAWRVQQYYSKNGNQDARFEVLFFLAELKNWRNRYCNNAWNTLWAHFRNHEEWDKAMRVALIKWDEKKAAHQIFIEQMNAMGRKWDKWKNDKGKQKRLMGEMKTFLGRINGKINGAGSVDAKRGLTFYLLNWLLSRKPPFTNDALNLMLNWFDKHPGDAATIDQFRGMAKHPAIPVQMIKRLYEAYFEKKPDDHGRRWHMVFLVADKGGVELGMLELNKLKNTDAYMRGQHLKFVVGVIERAGKWDIAKAELDFMDASNLEYGEHYYRKKEYETAIEYFTKVHNETKDPNLVADMAWRIAGCYRTIRNLTEAIKWYQNCIESKGFDATNMIAICYKDLGEWQKAVQQWTEIYNFAGKDKNWKGKAGEQIYQLLMQVGQRKQSISWCRRVARDTVGTGYPGRCNVFAGKHGFDIKGGEAEE